MMKIFANRYFLSVKKTQLYDLHVARKGKIVEFAGYQMPVQYPTGIIKQHLHCREHASIFDVSHMGQVYITGPDRVKLLQRVTVGNSKRNQICKSGRSLNGATESYLTMFLNQEAGIIDDAIAANLEKEELVRIVVNAGNKYIDMDHINKVISKENLNVKAHLDESLALIALQGPYAAASLQKLTQTDLSKIPFMSTFRANVNGKQYTISRSGYTGEDGFQISGNSSDINALTETLLKDEKVQLAGLGSRDSLRIQAGLCLHGHQITTSISPFESGLMWTVFKRQPNDSRVKFIGEDVLSKIVSDNKSGVRKDRKRVGFILDSSGIIRQNCKIFNDKGKQVGKTSSGGYSPVLKKCIGMAYVDTEYLKAGSKLEAEQRQKRHPLTINKMPIVQSRYYKGWNDFKA